MSPTDNETSSGPVCMTPDQAVGQIDRMVSYGAFRILHLFKTREQFLEDVPHPHLLLTFSRTVEAVEDIGTFHAMSSEQLEGGQLLALAPLTKRDKSNPFQEMITVGRAKNNDIVVKHKRVSKFHAYFRYADRQWTITDGGSRNGTLVDGVRLAAKRSHPLQDGSKIQLSDVLVVEFLTPEALYARVVGPS